MRVVAGHKTSNRPPSYHESGFIREQFGTRVAYTYISNMQHDLDDSTWRTFRVLRFCKSLSDLEDDELLTMVGDSINTFSAALYDYDTSLPKHLRAGKPKWIPMTCATVHISNITSQLNMDGKEALAFVKHVHLLYRFDDFLETAPSLYAISDVSSISDTIHDAFKAFDSRPATPAACDSEAGLTEPSHPRHDSAHDITQLDCPPGKGFLEHDILELIELLHETPVREASKFNQRWYTAELRRTMLAMVRQLIESPGPQSGIEKQSISPDTPGDTLRTWLHSTGASSVGTNYQFAFLACLVSARDQTPCWQEIEQQYLAQTFAQHVSTSWRIWNDLGGRVRDEVEGAFTSCSFVARGGGALDSLVRIADFEAGCAVSAQKRLFELENCGRDVESFGGEKSGSWCYLEFFRRAVHLSGEIYLAGDPTRSFTSRVV
jgi:hypothetical protein